MLPGLQIERFCRKHKLGARLTLELKDARLEYYVGVGKLWGRILKVDDDLMEDRIICTLVSRLIAPLVVSVPPIYYEELALDRGGRMWCIWRR